MHHLLATLGNGRMGYAQLGGYVLALESLYIEHLQNDAVLAVSAIIEIADVFYRLVKIVLKLVVGENQFLKNSFLSSYQYIFLISAIRLQIYTFSLRKRRNSSFFLFSMILKEKSGGKIKQVSKKKCIPLFTFPILEGHIIVTFMKINEYECK